MSNYTLRPAQLRDIDCLTQIAIRSKSYWGYSSKIINPWQAKLKVTPQFLQNAIHYVAERKETIKGFWIRSAVEELSEGRLFVEPSEIRKGCGKALWHAVMIEAKNRGLRYLTWEADSNAVGFYLKMGAVIIDSLPSKFVPGLQLPIMRYYL